MVSGPPPKPAGTRARANKPPISERVMMITPAGQPDMPTALYDGTPYPQETIDWWDMWRQHPLSAEFTASDWSFLRDTSVIHALFWLGDINQSAELRIRVAKFGATPEDRARLRITFATAEDTEAKVGAKKTRTAAPKKAPDREKDVRTIALAG